MSKKNLHNTTTKGVQGWSVKAPVILESSEVDTGRVNLDPRKFDKLIKGHGVAVCIYRSLFCPQVKSIDGAEHEISCNICNGSGFLDVRPIKVTAFIQGQSLEKQHLVEGLVDGNTVFITFPMGIELQYFTLIELRDHTDIYLQRVARSDTAIDKLKYKALRVNVLIDSANQEYYEGTDFSINTNGNIVWKTGKGPAAETIYSIHYEAKVQFRAIKAVHNNRYEQVKLESGEIGQVKFPEQWICTKEFLVKRKDYNGVEILPNNIPGYDDELEE